LEETELQHQQEGLVELSQGVDGIQKDSQEERNTLIDLQDSL